MARTIGGYNDLNDPRDEITAHVEFSEGYREMGKGEDGMPIFEPVTYVQLDIPPYTSIKREATEEDIAASPDAYRRYEATRTARTVKKGFPLTMWPAVSPAMFQTLSARGLSTIEELAALTGRGTPPDVLELVARAKQMMTLQKQTGQYESVITQLRAEVEALSEQLKEAHAQLSAQNAMIEQMRTKPNGAVHAS